MDAYKNTMGNSAELAGARTLITTLRGVITEQAQKVEDLEKQSYQDKLVRDGLVKALQDIAGIRKPQMCMDGSSIVGSPNATGYDYAMIARAALAAAGVTL